MEHLIQILKAVRFATCAHDGQYRKAPTGTGDGPPYVTHCFDPDYYLLFCTDAVRGFVPQEELH